MSLPARWWLAYPPPADALGIAAERLELRLDEQRREAMMKDPAAYGAWMRRLDAALATAERIGRERGDPPRERSEEERLAFERDPGLRLRVQRAVTLEVQKIRARQRS